ncbi:hypothetical protein GGI43DRAFT_386616 [Trichoderma evansii]
MASTCLAWIVTLATAQLHAESQLILEGSRYVREHDGDVIHFVFGTIGDHHVTLAYSEKERISATAAFMLTYFGLETFKLFIIGGVDITSNFPHHNLRLGGCIIDVPSTDENQFFMAERNVPPTVYVNANRLLLAVDRFMTENPNGILIENKGINYVTNAHTVYKHWDPEEWENLLCCGMQLGCRLPCIVIRRLGGECVEDGENFDPWFDVACQASAVVTKGIIERLELPE